MKKMSFLVLTVLLASTLFNVVNAQGIRNATPLAPHVLPAIGMFVFTTVDGTLANASVPLLDCNGIGRWSITVEEPGYNTVVAMVTTAKVTSRVIHVDGTGNCNPAGNGAEIGYVALP